ncbi:energy transducer TonB [Fluviicola sp.]|uniref:energy transducer TonB n=1 Tax=Fluviicola sp. TaxID=1917219 RepID=UPI0031DAAC21
MKKLVILSLLQFIYGLSFSQTDPEPLPASKQTSPPPKAVPKQASSVEAKELVYDTPEEPAEFPGGTSALKKYIAENLKFEGRCYLQFVVLESGEITDIKVKKGVTDCPECDEEAVRLIKSMPNWNPGKLNGKPVKSLYSLPVIFKLN